MVSRPTVATGEVWLASFDSVVGSAIEKTRLCVVVLPPEMHDYLRTVIVAPMTTGALRACVSGGTPTFQASKLL